MSERKEGIRPAVSGCCGCIDFHKDKNDNCNIQLPPLFYQSWESNTRERCIPFMCTYTKQGERYYKHINLCTYYEDNNNVEKCAFLPLLCYCTNINGDAFSLYTPIYFHQSYSQDNSYFGIFPVCIFDAKETGDYICLGIGKVGPWRINWCGVINTDNYHGCSPLGCFYTGKHGCMLPCCSTIKTREIQEYNENPEINNKIIEYQKKNKSLLYQEAAYFDGCISGVYPKKPVVLDPNKSYDQIVREMTKSLPTREKMSSTSMEPSAPMLEAKSRNNGYRTMANYNG